LTVASGTTLLARGLQGLLLLANLRREMRGLLLTKQQRVVKAQEVHWW
jgi:hypothetical protein